MCNDIRQVNGERRSYRVAKECDPYIGLGCSRGSMTYHADCNDFAFFSISLHALQARVILDHMRNMKF